MSLPADFEQEGLLLAHGAEIFGVPLESMSRDQLLAVAAQGWAACRRLSAENSKRSIDHIDDLARMRNAIRNGIPP